MNPSVFLLTLSDFISISPNVSFFSQFGKRIRLIVHICWQKPCLLKFKLVQIVEIIGRLWGTRLSIMQGEISHIMTI